MAALSDRCVSVYLPQTHHLTHFYKVLTKLGVAAKMAMAKLNKNTRPSKSNGYINLYTALTDFSLLVSSAHNYPSF